VLLVPGRPHRPIVTFSLLVADAKASELPVATIALVPAGPQIRHNAAGPPRSPPPSARKGPGPQRAAPGMPAGPAQAGR